MDMNWRQSEEATARAQNATCEHFNLLAYCLKCGGITKHWQTHRSKNGKVFYKTAPACSACGTKNEDGGYQSIGTAAASVHATAAKPDFDQMRNDAQAFIDAIDQNAALRAGAKCAEHVDLLLDLMHVTKPDDAPNVPAHQIQRCREAVGELRSMADQIITPIHSKTRKRLQDFAFSIEWLIESHSTMSALADQLHTQIQNDMTDDWPRHAAIEIEATWPDIDESAGRVEQSQQDAEAGLEHRWQAIETIINKHRLGQTNDAE